MNHYQDKEKSLEEINAEIEQQLIKEMENKENKEEKKKKRAIFSVVGLISFIILLRMLYNIVQLYL